MKEDLLKKYQLEAVRKRFQQLNEYSFNGILEDDEDNQNGMNQQPQQPQGGGMSQGGMDAQAPQGMDGGMGGQQPDGSMGGSQPDMNQQGGGMGMPDQQGMDGGMGMDNNPAPMDGGMGGEAPMGEPSADEIATGNDAPADEEGGDETPMGDEEGGEDEEVIDVDDLTNAQETTEYKIDGVDDKLTQILNVVDKFYDALQSNDKELADLRREFERRNPTPEERMNIRSQSSGPYGETPKDFWDKKQAENPNYNVIYDNDVAPQDEEKEYVIKRGDLDNLDTKSVADSFELPKKLTDYISF